MRWHADSTKKNAIRYMAFMNPEEGVTACVSYCQPCWRRNKLDPTQGMRGGEGGSGGGMVSRAVGSCGLIQL